MTVFNDQAVENFVQQIYTSILIQTIESTQPDQDLVEKAKAAYQAATGVSYKEGIAAPELNVPQGLGFGKTTAFRMASARFSTATGLKLILNPSPETLQVEDMSKAFVLYTIEPHENVAFGIPSKNLIEPDVAKQDFEKRAREAIESVENHARHGAVLLSSGRSRNEADHADFLSRVLGVQDPSNHPVIGRKGKVIVFDVKPIKPELVNDSENKKPNTALESSIKHQPGL